MSASSFDTIEAKMPERIFVIYKEIFKKMEELYFSDKEKYNSFGIILGQMSPDIFSDSKSADSAWFSEFDALMQEFENPTLHDGYRVLEKMVGEYNHASYDIGSFMRDFFEVGAGRKKGGAE